MPPFEDPDHLRGRRDDGGPGVGVGMSSPASEPTSRAAAATGVAVGVATFDPMAYSRTVVFTRIAREVSAEARRAGLAVPVFRSPPPDGMDRSLRRTPTGAVVSLRTRDRDWTEVATDVVDGILAVNRDREVPGEVVDALRTAAEAALPSPN